MKRLIGVNLILGVWLMVAPFALRYATGHTSASSNDVVIGLVLVGCSLWILTSATTPLGALALESLCGAWLFLAPLALQKRAVSDALANNAVVGAIVLLISLGEIWAQSGRHHAA